MTRALVLGAGGQTAIGWEVGVLEGLALGGVPDRWDLVVGTSAGSVVGAWLAAGRLHAVYEKLTTKDPAIDRAAMATGMGNHLPYLLGLPGRAGRAAGMVWTAGAVASRLAGAMLRRGPRSLPVLRAALGRYLGPDALTVEELAALAPLSVGVRQRHIPRWEAYWAERLEPETGWPQARLGVVASCATSGEVRLFEAHDGAPIARVIAASTAVPGIVGAVEIDGNHYVDAGPHDSTSAHLAAGFDEVLILAPAPGPTELTRHVARLETGGTRVTVVQPSDSASFGEGIQHLDAMRVPAAVALGFHDGRAAAPDLTGR